MTRRGDRRRDPRRRFRNPGVLAVLALCLTLAACGQEYPQSTIDTVTGDFGAAIEKLYTLVFWWSIVILALVWTVLGYVLFRFRARKGGPEPRRIRGHLGLEIGWTLGAAVIVILISIPTIQTVFRTQTGSAADPLVVEVVGRQWWWELRYPEQGVVTANEMHLPVGRPVEFHLMSGDVIHSFWVPRLGGKRDLNPWVRKPDGSGPGFNLLKMTVDEPGVYYGQCAEFCGPSHALMGMRVIAEPEAEFQAWVDRMNSPTEPDSGTVAERGRQIFMRSTCIACHAIEGTNAQGVLGPNLTRLGARTTIAAGMLENSRENLIDWIIQPSEFKPGVKMPGVAEGGGGMPGTGLSQEEVEAVAAYLLSLK